MSDLKHYLDCYAKENFIEEYMEYLIRPDGNCIYEDIDSVTSKNICFYRDLSTFLRKALGLKFEELKEPDKDVYPFAIKYQDMYLTSDQFGFSAPCKDKTYKNYKYYKSPAWNGEKSYPYARYLSIKRDDKGAEDIGKSEFVAKCIYETRTIGGSFIWPKVKVEVGTRKSYQSLYNLKRGARSYIEDRVDITLYEIKCFYDFCTKYFGNDERRIDGNPEKIMAAEEDFIEAYTNTEEYSANILINKQPFPEKRALYRWLMMFGSFEDYVEKLKFEPFVIQKNDTYLIRDMASKDRKSQLNDITKIKKIRDMNSDELYTLLMNVKECTQERSRAIQDLLKKKDI